MSVLFSQERNPVGELWLPQSEKKLKKFYWIFKSIFTDSLGHNPMAYNSLVNSLSLPKFLCSFLGLRRQTVPGRFGRKMMDLKFHPMIFLIGGSEQAHHLSIGKKNKTNKR